MIIAESFLSNNDNLVNIRDFYYDPNYFDITFGSVKFNINNVEILFIKDNLIMVEFVWGFIINGIEEIEKGIKYYESSVPDLVISFYFQMNEDHSVIIFKFNGKQVAVDYKEFVSGIAYYAKEYFDQIARIDPSTKKINQYYLEKIKELEEKYGKYIPDE